MLEFYGLREHPFGVSPNPRYLYPSVQHREALASLINGIDELVGFAALIAEPGAGKTTLLFDVLLRYRDRASTAFVFNTQCSGHDLLRYIVMELQIPGGELEQDPIRLHQIFTAFVADRTRTKPVVIIIDEAQNLEASALETLRLLSNFEAAERKLLHIILAGQPQLRDKLRSSTLTQLRQRIMIISRLGRLSPQQTEECIAFRLRVAGYAGSPLFTDQALAKIKVASGGVPREINRICINALQIGFALRQNPIGVEVIDEVLSDLDLDHDPEPRTESLTAAPWIGLKPEEVFPKTPILPKEVAPVAAALVPQLSIASNPITQKTVPPRQVALQVAEAVAPTPIPVMEVVGQGVQSSEGGSVAAQRALSVDVKARPSPPAVDSRPKIPGASAPVAQPSVVPVAAREIPAKVTTEKVEHKAQSGISTATLVIPICCALLAALVLFVMAGVVPVPTQLRSVIGPGNSSTMASSKPQAAPVAAAPLDAEAQNTNTAAGEAIHNEAATPPSVRKIVVVNREPLVRAHIAPAAPTREIPSYAIDPADVVPGRRRQPAAMAISNPPVSPPPPIANNGAPSKNAPSSNSNAIKDSAVAATETPSTSRASDDKNALKKFVRPVFPSMAKQMHLAGEVSLHVDIAGDGSVREIQVLSGDPVLVRAARDAVQQWQYQSTNGSPVTAEEKIIVSFRDAR